MDAFSLEEDDYGDLFITQEVNNGDGKELVKMLIIKMVFLV